MNIIPKSIKRTKPGLIQAIWDDGFDSTIKIAKLRSNCPCADCREKNKEPQNNNQSKIMMPLVKSGENNLTKLTPMGNYAINAEWADGHTAGIYPWEYFREIFEKNKLNEDEINNTKINEPIILDIKKRSN